MILSDNRSLAILTPTKTGTMSLEKALGGRGFFVKMPRHARHIPEDYARPLSNVAVIVVARHPHDRMVSMYRFGLSRMSASSWFYRLDMSTFEGFLRGWAEQRDRGRRTDWTSTISDYVREAKAARHPVYVLDAVALGTRGFAAHLEPYVPGIRDAAPAVHVNASGKLADRKKWWTRAAHRVVGDRLDEDLKLHYKYERP